MRFDFGIIEVGAGVHQGLTHFLAEPAIVSLAVAHELKRKHSFVGCARQQNPHGADADHDHRGGLFLYVCVDAGLDEGI